MPLHKNDITLSGPWVIRKKQQRWKVKCLGVTSFNYPFDALSDIMNYWILRKCVITPILIDWVNLRGVMSLSPAYPAGVGFRRTHWRIKGPPTFNQLCFTHKGSGLSVFLSVLMRIYVNPNMCFVLYCLIFNVNTTKSRINQAEWLSNYSRCMCLVMVIK